MVSGKYFQFFLSVPMATRALLRTTLVENLPRNTNPFLINSCNVIKDSYCSSNFTYITHAHTTDNIRWYKLPDLKPVELKSIALTKLENCMICVKSDSAHNFILYYYYGLHQSPLLWNGCFIKLEQVTVITISTLQLQELSIKQPLLAFSKSC